MGFVTTDSLPMKKLTTAKTTGPNTPASQGVSLNEHVARLANEWWHQGLQNAAITWPMECGLNLGLVSGTKVNPERDRS